MARTNVMLDSLRDPLTARRLSAAWAAAGLLNLIDTAGRHAELWTISKSGNEQPLDEPATRTAGIIAAGFGLLLTDRVGAAFQPVVTLTALRDRLGKDHRARFATLLMFGLPAIALHHLGPMLAAGGDDTRAMLYPWLIEALLTGWIILAVGFPILWQAAAALLHLRPTADVLTVSLLAIAWGPSLLGVVAILLHRQPWFAATAAGQPLFHAVVFILALDLLQRWAVTHHTPRLATRGRAMLPGFDRFAGLWLLATLAAVCFVDWHRGLALGILLPTFLSFGAIQPRPVGWANLLPVVAFALLLLFAADRFVPITTVEAHIAAAFVLLNLAVHIAGWRRLPVQEPAPCRP